MKTIATGESSYLNAKRQCSSPHGRPRRAGTTAPNASGVLGVTIVELLVALTVAAILMGLGAPAFGGFIRNNRLSQSSFDVLRTFNLARSEAVKRRVRVILCRSADSTAPAPTCGGTANIWTTGWLVFASGDGNNTFQVGVDTLLGIGVVGSNGITVKTNSTSNNNLEYNPDGTTNEGGGTARFALCDNRGGDYGRQIDVPPHGRPKFIKGKIGSPINCTTPT